jgi:hypothetical protein
MLNKNRTKPSMLTHRATLSYICCRKAVVPELNLWDFLMSTWPNHLSTRTVNTLSRFYVGTHFGNRAAKPELSRIPASKLVEDLDSLWFAHGYGKGAHAELLSALRAKGQFPDA